MTGKYNNRNENPAHGSDSVSGGADCNCRDNACLVSTIGKYKNRYRVPSARATWWSYGWAGAYFITICTADRRNYFGRIVNHSMILSPTGELANRFWFEIPDHAINVDLGAFIVMPNHVHGILILRGNDGRADGDGGIGFAGDVDGDIGADRDGDIGCTEYPECNIGVDRDVGPGCTGYPECNIGADCNRRDKACLVSTMPRSAPLLPPRATQPPENEQQSGLSLSRLRYQNQGRNTVSSIVGGYKSAVSRHARQAGFTFAWQSRFHDHIIRNDDEFQRINDYIESNPQQWNSDRFFAPAFTSIKGTPHG